MTRDKPFFPDLIKLGFGKKKHNNNYIYLYKHMLYVEWVYMCNSV